MFVYHVGYWTPEPTPTTGQNQPYHMQPFTLNKAAKACHKSKSAILAAIRTGRLSASRNDLNQWQIDPAELFRVYPASTGAEQTYQVDHTNQEPTKTTQENHSTTMMLDRIASIEVERERERQQLQATIDDLRHRLTMETEERRKLTAWITHQPEKKPEPASEQVTKSFLFEKLFGRK